MKILISILPIIITSLYIYIKNYKFDNKRQLLKYIVFGVFSVILTILLGNVLIILIPILKYISIYEGYLLFIGIFVTVGIVEELSKWIFIKIGKYKNSNELFFKAVTLY